MRLDETTIKRFWSKVDKRGDDECWTWQTSRKAKGYGQFYLDGKIRLSHRVSFQMHYPDKDVSGLFVCHSCDNPPCCNPAHLFLGTAKDNIDDMMSKGRNTLVILPSQAVLTPHQVKEIRARADSGERPASIARDYPVKYQTVHAVIKRINWKDL